MASLAGSFLVARPMLKDPNFFQTVVLMLQHNGEGAFGLVVNRRANVEGVPFPVYVGGPCPSQGLLMVHGHEDWASEVDDQPPARVAPGIFMGDAECLKRVTDGDEDEEFRFRVCVGYAGWGPDQLEGELAEGAWFVTAATPELLFDTPVDELWDRLSPPSIPQPSIN